MRFIASILSTSLLLAAACHDVKTPLADAGPDTDADSDVDGPIMALKGVDVLLVLDNSISMGEEQKSLSSAMFSLVNALMDPVSGVGVGDVRIGVVTTDMGLSWGGHPYEEGDGWPGDMAATSCDEAGDDGALQSYPEGTTLMLGDDEVACPAPEDPWITGDPASPDDDFALEAACLTQQGTLGCGWEQPLASASRALHRVDKELFLRADALLAIVVVSDEDDCSMEDGPGMFATDEVQAGMMTPACLEHTELLYTVEHYIEDFRSAKGGAVNGVFLGAIVGVPQGPACEGFGDHISDCLQQEEMMLTRADVGEMIYYLPACERWEDYIQLTKALPARRMVQLAIDLGERGYVSSICDEDWSGAMGDMGRAMAKMIDDYQDSWFE